MGGKINESITLSWEINKKKKVKKEVERECQKWVDNVAVNVAQQECSNNKCYVLAFRNIQTSCRPMQNVRTYN